MGHRNRRAPVRPPRPRRAASPLASAPDAASNCRAVDRPGRKAARRGGAALLPPCRRIKGRVMPNKKKRIPPAPLQPFSDYRPMPALDAYDAADLDDDVEDADVDPDARAAAERALDARDRREGRVGGRRSRLPGVLEGE